MIIIQQVNSVNINLNCLPYNFVLLLYIFVLSVHINMPIENYRIILINDRKHQLKHKKVNLGRLI